MGVPAQPTPAARRSAILQRAAAGAAAIGLQGAAVQVLAFVGSLVLARLLEPRDFGTVAFGLALTSSLGLVASAGLGASLIRGERDPTPRELGALFGFQLTLTVALALVAALAVSPFGKVGRVTALMVLALPATALRTPPTVLLERRLAYRALAWAGTVEALAYYLWTIPAVAWGAGVWGLASGTVVRAVCGTAVVLAAEPRGIVPPSFQLARVRGLLGFGARYQAAELTSLARDQGFNVGLASLAGLTTLGLWSLAGRLLQVPLLLYSSLWRVSFPAMARLRDAGADMRDVLERTTAVVAVASGVMLVPLAASAPALIPAVVGERWERAADILPGVCAGLAFSGPISVATAGYLWATGDAKGPLRAVLAHTAVWLGLGLALFPLLDVWSIGVGALAASAVDAVVLVRATNRLIRARLVRPLAEPYVCALLSGAAWWVVARGGETLPRALAAAAGSELVFLALLAATRRALLAETWRLSVRAAHGAVARAQPSA